MELLRASMRIVPLQVRALLQVRASDSGPIEPDLLGDLDNHLIFRCSILFILYYMIP